MSRQVLTLLMVVFFAFVGLSLPYPIFAVLFLHSDSTFINNSSLAFDYRHVLLGFTLAAYPLAQFFGSPILGSLSDRYGRKKLLILTILGTGLGYLLSGLAITNNAIALLILSRMLTGFLEGNLGIAQASILDMKMDKYKGLGAVSALSSLGYLVGPLLGGFLCDNTLNSGFNTALPFFVGCGMAVLLSFFVVIWFQETNKKPDVKTLSLLSEFNVFKKIKNIYRKPVLRNAFLFMIFLSLSIDCYYEFYPAFLVEEWQMTPKLIGIYSVLLSLALSIGSFLIPQYLKRKSDPLIYRRHLLFIFILSLTSLLFATTNLTLNVHFFIVGLSYAALNTIQSVAISDQASENEQGEMMGLQWGLRMLGDSLLCIVGSLLLSLSHTFPIILAILFSLASTFIFLPRFGKKVLT